MSKKILLITQNFYPEIGSAANRMKNIYKFLNKKHKVNVLTANPTYPNQEIYEDEKFWKDSPTEVTRIKTRTKFYTSNLLLRMILYLETILKMIFNVSCSKEKYDTIFISTPPIFISLVGFIAKKKWQAKLIIDVRDLWPETLLGIGKIKGYLLLKIAYYFEKKMYQVADQIIVNSEAFSDYLIKKGVDKNVITYIPNGLTTEELMLPKKIKQTKKTTIIYTGNIGLAQNLEVLLQIACQLQYDQTVQFKIVGYGYKKEQLIKKIIEKKLTNTITVLPPDTRENVLAMTIDADIAFLSLEDHDVFNSVVPGKLIDYMGCGVPILGVLSGYSQSIVENNKCGFVYKKNEIDKIITDIFYLRHSKKVKSKFGENGYRYAKANYNWAINSKKLIKVVDDE